MRNRSINPIFRHFPVLPYGRYLFTLAFIDQKDETFGLIVIDGDATPRL